MTTLGNEAYQYFGIAHNTDIMRTLMLVAADELDFSIGYTPPRWQFTTLVCVSANKQTTRIRLYIMEHRQECDGEVEHETFAIFYIAVPAHLMH